MEQVTIKYIHCRNCGVGHENLKFIYTQNDRAATKCPACNEWFDLCVGPRPEPPEKVLRIVGEDNPHEVEGRAQRIENKRMAELDGKLDFLAQRIEDVARKAASRDEFLARILDRLFHDQNNEKIFQQERSNISQWDSFFKPSFVDSRPRPRENPPAPPADGEQRHEKNWCHPGEFKQNAIVDRFTGEKPKIGNKYPFTVACRKCGNNDLIYLGQNPDGWHKVQCDCGHHTIFMSADDPDFAPRA